MALFIPKKIRVGFQKRQGTFTEKLGYVIYYGPDNKIRKEKSWIGWCDKKLGSLEIDNEPTEGFILNKGHTRYNWSSFGDSKRVVVRVYDSRDFEFEISTENLVGILMDVDCNKRGLQDKFVYAWSGQDLVLLPCSSQEYKDSVEFTNRLSQKFSAKDLVAGRSYKTKRDGDVVYLGRFDWYERKTDERKLYKKQHIFFNPKNQKKDFYGNDCRYIAKGSAEMIASCNGDNIVTDFAKIMEGFTKNTHSSDIKSYQVGSIGPIQKKKGNDYYWDDRYFYGKTGDRIDIYNVGFNYHEESTGVVTCDQYLDQKNHSFKNHTKPSTTQKYVYDDPSTYRGGKYVTVPIEVTNQIYSKPFRSREELDKIQEELGLGNLKVIFENGNEITVNHRLPYV